MNNRIPCRACQYLESGSDQWPCKSCIYGTEFNESENIRTYDHFTACDPGHPGGSLQVWPVVYRDLNGNLAVMLFRTGASAVEYLKEKRAQGVDCRMALEPVPVHE